MHHTQLKKLESKGLSTLSLAELENEVIRYKVIGTTIMEDVLSLIDAESFKGKINEDKLEMIELQFRQAEKEFREVSTISEESAQSCRKDAQEIMRNNQEQCDSAVWYKKTCEVLFSKENEENKKIITELKLLTKEAEQVVDEERKLLEEFNVLEMEEREWGQRQESLSVMISAFL